MGSLSEVVYVGRSYSNPQSSQTRPRALSNRLHCRTLHCRARRAIIIISMTMNTKHLGLINGLVSQFKSNRINLKCFLWRIQIDCPSKPTNTTVYACRLGIKIRWVYRVARSSRALLFALVHYFIVNRFSIGTLTPEADCAHRGKEKFFSAPKLV